MCKAIACIPPNKAETLKVSGIYLAGFMRESEEENGIGIASHWKFIYHRVLVGSKKLLRKSKQSDQKDFKTV